MEKNTEKRRKPKFLRADWHKKIKLGSRIKKKRKWSSAKGVHSKIRLGKKGHTKRPKIGWGSPSKLREKINGLEVVRVSNLEDLKNVRKHQAIIIAHIGEKKKQELIKKAEQEKITILNKYRRN